MDDSNDFFAVRGEIAEKLKEITGILQIYTPANSAKVTEMSQITPSAHIYFMHLVPSSSAGNGDANMITQRYAVTIACRNAQSQLDNSAVLDQAGSLLCQVIRLLRGWQPDSAIRKLKFVDAQDADSVACSYLSAIFDAVIEI